MTARARIGAVLAVITAASCAQTGTVARLCPAGESCIEGFFPGYGESGCEGAKRSLILLYCTPERLARLRLTVACAEVPTTLANGHAGANQTQCKACFADGGCAEVDDFYAHRARDDAAFSACSMALDGAKAAVCRPQAGSTCGDACARGFAPH